ncbi:signal peptidase II [Pelagibacterales bacterium SAG-MED43]|nr:signal peptidase II [Pelagibacterales bacterium SAG-MED43]
MSDYLKKNFFNFSIIIFVFFLDRISKYLILEYFEKSIDQNIIISSFLNFNLLWNDGIAFGLLQFEQKLFYNFVTLLIFVILIIVGRLASNSEGLEKICYLMILGGGFGNVFDRLYYGSVVDFIDLNYNNFHWFIFNVADMFITIGILILIIYEFVKKK